MVKVIDLYLKRDCPACITAETICEQVVKNSLVSVYLKKHYVESGSNIIEADRVPVTYLDGIEIASWGLTEAQLLTSLGTNN